MIANLYIITRGTTTYRYTDYDVDLEYDGAEYESIVCAHSTIKQTTSLDESTCEVQVPADGEMAYLLLVDEIDEMVVTILQAEVSDSRDVGLVKQLYVGSAAGVGTSDGLINIALSHRAVGESRSIPTGILSQRCRHAFCDKNCKKDTDGVEHVVEILYTNIATKQITLDYTPERSNYFAGGVVILEGRSISIINSSVDEDGHTILKLARWATLTTGGSALVSGSFIKCRAGCLHTRTACIQHDNYENFGGFPFVPVENPAIDGVGKPDAVNDTTEYPDYPDSTTPGWDGVPGDPYESSSVPSGYGFTPNTSLSYQLGCFLWSDGQGNTHPFMSPYLSDADRSTLVTDQRTRGFNRMHIYSLNDDNYSARRPGPAYWPNVSNRAVFAKFCGLDIPSSIPMPVGWLEKTATEDYTHWIEQLSKIRDAGLKITLWLFPNDAASTFNNASVWTNATVIKYCTEMIKRVANYQYKGGNLADEVVLKLEADDEWSILRCNEIGAAVKPILNGQTFWIHNQDYSPSTLNAFDYTIFDGLRLQFGGFSETSSDIQHVFRQIVNSMTDTPLLYASEYTTSGYEKAFLGDAILQIAGEFGGRLRGVDCGATPSKWTGSASGEYKSDGVYTSVADDTWEPTVVVGPSTQPRAWTKSISLDSVAFNNSTINFQYSKQTPWETVDIDPDEGVNLSTGNLWVIQKIGGVAYACTFDYIRPGQTSKAYPACLTGEGHTTSPITWVKGQTYGIMITTLARQTYRSTDERSNIILVVAQ